MHLKKDRIMASSMSAWDDYDVFLFDCRWKYWDDPEPPLQD
jgi:hypothetical protein